MNPQQQSEPQPTQVPVFKTITFGEIIQMVVLPKFQRPEIESHSNEILNFELKHKKERGHFLFPNSGVIVLGSSPDSQKMSVLDGQHRLTVIMKLIQMNPKNAEEKVNVIMIFGDADYFHDTYNRINSNIKAEIILTRNITEVINQTIGILKKEFREFVSNTKRPHRPNINFENLLKAIKDSKIVEILGIVEEKDLYGKLMELNDYYKSFSKSDFKKCGIVYEDGKEEKNGKKFYLGFWNLDFEFLARIIQKHRDNIEYYEQDHSSWLKDMNKVKECLEEREAEMSICGCCENEMVKEETEWCWKKSLYQGGEIKVENVVFVCGKCMEETGKYGFVEVMASKKKVIEEKKMDKEEKKDKKGKKKSEEDVEKGKKKSKSFFSWN
jgi:hypothetical protein